MFPYRSPIDADTAPIEVMIAAQSVRLRASQSIHSGPIVAVAGVACGGLLWWLGGGWLSLVWALGVVLGAWINRRACASIANLPESAAPAQVGDAENRLWWLTIMNTATVTAGIWLNGLQTDDVRVLFLVTMVIALYTLGALINASTHPPTFIAGACLNLGSAIAFWAIQGAGGWVPAVALSGLLLLVVRFSGQIRQEFARSVRIRNENTELLARLRAEMDATLAARHVAEQANVAKSRFLAAASHDLRQPLHALMLYSSLLERGTREQRGQFVQHIQSTAASLDRIFGELLDLSKLDAGAVSVSPQIVDIRALVAPLVADAAAAGAQKGLSLTADLHAIDVRTDPFLFERVLRNLLDNAVKYTARGGVHVVIDTEPDRVHVRVRDTGPGIAAEDRERVFDEFHRVVGAPRSMASGSGLGLAIVRRLCALLGHPVSLESSPGSGSTFSVTLPRAGIGQGAVTSPDDERGGTWSPPSDADVLLLDDDEGVRGAMSDMLLSWGCRPQAFRDIDAMLGALVDWRGRAPAALIADYRLGEPRTGLDAVRAAREYLPALPALIITGDLEVVRETATGTSGVTVYRKPVTEVLLAEWLRAAITPAAEAEFADGSAK